MLNILNMGYDYYCGKRNNCITFIYILSKVKQILELSIITPVIMPFYCLFL